MTGNSSFPSAAIALAGEYRSWSLFAPADNIFQEVTPFCMQVVDKIHSIINRYGGVCIRTLSIAS
jgi:hypothetical protein